MKKYIISALFILSSSGLFAQAVSATRNPFGEFKRKKIYNYVTANIFLNSPSGLNETQSIHSIVSATCIANGKYHQFGIGTGFISHTANADTARVNYTGIPIYLTNRFYLGDPESGQLTLYLECHAGYNLPLSGTYQSGNREGQPVPPLLPKGTGFFGVSFGGRIPLHGGTAMILEFIYRDQHLPYPGKENFYPQFLGVGGGVCF